MQSSSNQKITKSFSPSPALKLELVVVSLVINVLGLALPIALLQVYDRILPNQSLGTVSLLASGVAIAILLEALMRFSRLAILGSVGASFEYGLSSAAYKHLLASDLIEFEKTSAGEHLERMNALTTVRDHYSGQAFMSLLDLPFAFVYLGLMYYLAGFLVVIPLVLFIGAITMAWFVGSRLRLDVANLGHVDDRRSTFLIKALNDLFTVKSVSLETTLKRRFEAVQDERVVLAHDVDMRTNLLRNISISATQVSIVLVAAFGSLMVLGGTLTVGSLAASTLLAGRGLQPLQAMTAFWARSQTIQNALDRIDAIFKLPLERTMDTSSTGRIPASQIQGRLELENVSFRFDPDGTDAVKDISIIIEPGEMVAFVGPNNSGKSVLLQLFAGILKPTQGQALLDDRPMDAFDAVSLQEVMAVLPQHETMFNGTIMDNITLFRPQLEDRAREAANIMDLGGTIEAMPRGFNTRIGDGPQDTLPRGVAQRVAIARALVGVPKIILFDEANSAVDFQGDEAVKKFLSEIHGSSTVLIISHRPSILDIADRIIHIADGQLETED